MASLSEIRHDLHRIAERSGRESATRAYLLAEIAKTNPTRIVDPVGKTGFVAVWEGAAPGTSLMLRADMDALPLTETGELAYRSNDPETSHLCGHDGHSTILLGVARELAKCPPECGRVMLLFQPAEETGEGGGWVAEDPAFIELAPEIIVGLHNLPGYSLGTTFLKRGTFALASVGAEIALHGTTAHAAYPETGNSPLAAVTTLLQAIPELPAGTNDAEALATIIHARLGSVAFGTSPGEAVVMATLRASADESLEKMRQQLVRYAKEAAERDGLRYAVRWHEPFPATVNDDQLVADAAEAFLQASLPVDYLPAPMRWSEDFGHYSRAARTLFMGLGAGENHPPLHDPAYDFPDELLEAGVKGFMTLVRRFV